MPTIDEIDVKRPGYTNWVCYLGAPYLNLPPIGTRNGRIRLYYSCENRETRETLGSSIEVDIPEQMAQDIRLELGKKISETQ
jgi:hypothetical protein